MDWWKVSVLPFSVVVDIHNMNNELWFNGPKFLMGSTRPESLSAEEIIDNVDYTNEGAERCDGKYC